MKRWKQLRLIMRNSMKRLGALFFGFMIFCPLFLMIPAAVSAGPSFPPISVPFNVVDAYGAAIKGAKLEVRDSKDMPIKEWTSDGTSMTLDFDHVEEYTFKCDYAPPAFLVPVRVRFKIGYSEGKLILLRYDQGSNSWIATNAISMKLSYKTTAIWGKKTWKDKDNAANKRPDQIYIHLVSDNYPQYNETKAVSALSAWEWRFENLREYVYNSIDGTCTKIEYHIEETPILGYDTDYEGANVTNTYTGVFDIPDGTIGLLLADLFASKSGGAWDSEHDATFKVEPGDAIDLIAELDIAEIKQRLADAEAAGFPTGPDGFMTKIDQISENIMRMLFELDNGLTVTDPAATFSIEGTGLLKVAADFLPDASATSKKYEIKLSFTEDYSGRPYTDFSSDVQHLPDILRVKLSNVRVENAIAPGQYSVRLLLAGNNAADNLNLLISLAGPESMHIISSASFNFYQQIPVGNDFIMGADISKIQLTAEVLKNEEPPVPTGSTVSTTSTAPTAPTVPTAPTDPSTPQISLVPGTSGTPGSHTPPIATEPGPTSFGPKMTMPPAPTQPVATEAAQADAASMLPKTGENDLPAVLSGLLMMSLAAALLLLRRKLH